MFDNVRQGFRDELASIDEAGLTKHERIIVTADYERLVRNLVQERQTRPAGCTGNLH